MDIPIHDLTAGPGIGAVDLAVAVHIGPDRTRNIKRAYGRSILDQEVEVHDRHGNNMIELHIVAERYGQSQARLRQVARIYQVTCGFGARGIVRDFARVISQGTRIVDVGRIAIGREEPIRIDQPLGTVMRDLRQVPRVGNVVSD